MNEWLFRYLNSGIKSDFLDRVMPVFSDKDFVTLPALVGVALLLFLSTRRIKWATLALVLAVLVSDIGSEKFLKNIFKEPRPYARWDNVNVFRSGEWNFSEHPLGAFETRVSNAFPSTHASNVAAVATGLAFMNPYTLIATIPLSVLVGLSRIYTGAHTPLDVLAGYIWGAAVALIIFGVLFKVAGKKLVSDKPEPRPAVLQTQEGRAFLFILFLWTFINFSFVYFGNLSLSGDEAQYWDWSRHLQLSYYSKPPLIAYLIRMLTHLAGNKEWAIRSGAVFLSSGTLALLYALTKRIAGNERAAMLAVFAAIGMPATWVGSVLMTVDPALLFFWVLAMYAFHRAVSGEKYQWILLGIALGLAGLSKYTIMLLVVSFALYLLLVDRKWLRTFWPYLSLLLMLVCLSGVIYWNWINGWASVRHTAAIGAGTGPSVSGAFEHFAEFWGGQLMVVSPILFIFFGWTVYTLARRFRHNRNAAFLFLCFIVIFGFSTILSLTRKTMVNWPVASYMAVLPALGWIWEQQFRSVRARRWLTIAIILGAVLGLTARSTDLIYLAAAHFTGPNDRPDRIHLGPLSIDPDKDPTNDLHGGKELGAALSKYVEPGQVKGSAPFLFATRYQLTAWEAFYTKDRPRAYCLNYDRRYNQYDLWGGWDKLVGRDGLFVTGGDAAKAQAYIEGMVAAGAFSSGEFLEQIDIYRGKTLIRSFTISLLRNYSGLQPTPEGNW